MRYKEEYKMKLVAKFGGSSLADAGQFRKVADIIKSNPDRKYIVVSAPGKRDSKDTKVTDLLYAAYDAAIHDDPFEKPWKLIKKRFDGIIEDLGMNMDLSAEFDEIEKNFKAAAGREYAASRGEYLNGRLMAAYLGFEFIDAADVIVFDEHGVLDSRQTNEKLQAALEGREYVVIPGFYGKTYSGRTMTFSRGGSDVTGSLVANAVGADTYENWTDVSGMLVADPRIVENPPVIETITYLELRELSYMGASVMHEDAIFPVMRNGIPIHILNTNRPGDKGTVIVESTCKTPASFITGVAGKQGYCSINIDKAMMNSEIGFCAKVLKVFADCGISIEHMPSGVDTMSVVVHQSEFEDHEQQVLAGIHRAVDPDKIWVESGISLVAVVGRGMKSMRGVAGRVFSALAHSGVNVKMIDQGSSEMNIIIGVRDQDFEAAINGIYGIFVS
jgi:aspartate kinase